MIIRVCDICYVRTHLSGDLKDWAWAMHSLQRGILVQSLVRKCFAGVRNRKVTSRDGGWVGEQRCEMKMERQAQATSCRPLEAEERSLECILWAISSKTLKGSSRGESGEYGWKKCSGSRDSHTICRYEKSVVRLLKFRKEPHISCREMNMMTKAVFCTNTLSFVKYEKPLKFKALERCTLPMKPIPYFWNWFIVRREHIKRTKRPTLIHCLSFKREQ